MNLYKIMPPEWADVNLVQLTWPHAGTDWNYMLAEVTECYIQLTEEVATRCKTLIVTPDIAEAKHLLQERISNEAHSNITFHQCPTNDTWARDHAFISVWDSEKKEMQLLDYRFDGWGGKFEASLDNAINQSLHKAGIVNGPYKSRLNFTLEGGSIESDGKGTILTTSECLLNPNRNPELTKELIEQQLQDDLGATNILWLEHGYLAGDDTDSHIDTLARLCPNDTILYVASHDTNDEHHQTLKAMEAQLQSFQTCEGKPFRLIKLPMADKIEFEGERLPATYANFLILNKSVLMPTYKQPHNDTAAARAIQEAFPDYEIIGIDCSALIKQHGSLHCATMQYPAPIR